MSNGTMLHTIKKLIEDGDDFTVKQFRTMTLTGMVELGENISEMRGEIKQVNSDAQSRICPEVKQAQIDIGKLEKKSNRSDTIVGVGTVIGSVIGFVFGSK